MDDLSIYFYFELILIAIFKIFFVRNMRVESNIKF